MITFDYYILYLHKVFKKKFPQRNIAYISPTYVEAQLTNFAPGPNSLNAAAYLMQTLDSGRSLAFDVECCKTYLFRPTNEFPSLWLPLLILKHQRMRNCKERLQRNLPINIWLSVKFGNTNHIKFFLWKISFTIKSSMVVFTTGAKTIWPRLFKK